MAIFETFSKRQKRLQSAGKQDVYQYDDFPQEFRVQAIHIWRSAIGTWRSAGYGFGHSSPSNKWWTSIHDTLAREMGTFNLGQQRRNHFEQCQEFLLAADSSGVLDIIELSFRVIERAVSKASDWDKKNAGIEQSPEDAIAELNHRFQEYGIGYEYRDGQLIRRDSQFIHEEIVKPALTLLHGKGFEGASDEFRRAHEHYRHGRNKEAIVEALKAFESTMKGISAARKWACPDNATAKQLIEIVFEKHLIAPELASSFKALRSLLESGLPTVRNRTSGHGQGVSVTSVPTHLAAYALHLAAANIVFLVEAHRQTR